MNNTEAMRVLDENIKYAKNLKKWQRCEEEIEMMDLCRLALEKQIPKRAKEQEINNSGDLIGLCSVCRKRWVNKYQKYCAECGTRLDWSVEE